jgi:hypothetical protein
VIQSSIKVSHKQDRNEASRSDGHIRGGRLTGRIWAYDNWVGGGVFPAGLGPLWALRQGRGQELDLSTP